MNLFPAAHPSFCRANAGEVRTIYEIIAASVNK
jgi:hypothetical protein